MKILVSIATYGIKNVEYLKRVIDEYKSFKNHDIDIIVHGTTPLNRNDITFITHEDPECTVYYHRNDFIEKQNEYDYFLFSEDDILISEQTIDTYIRYDSILPHDHCLGFLRYENTPEKIKYLIDLWLNVPGYDYIKSSCVQIDKHNYFTVTNPHQSCYILSQVKLKYTIANSRYIRDNCSMGLETSSSGIFTDWVLGGGPIQKVLPLSHSDLKKCLIEHLPGNHCNPPGINSSTPSAVFKTRVATETLLLEKLQQ